MRPRRLLLPGQLHLVTTRVQEGLPFTCTPYMELIVESALALAQTLYQTRICGFCVMGNHIHLILWVDDPQGTVSFMERFKTEVSHAINRCLGRRQRTVWCSGYDSPVILTSYNIVDRFIYVFTNPQCANLVESIDQYPGLSSWSIFKNKQLSKQVRRVRRYHLERIPTSRISLDEQEEIAKQIRNQAKSKLELKITPVSEWINALDLDETADQLHQQLIDGVRERERELAIDRKAQNKTVIGAEKLRLEPFNKPHTPKKFSRRMWCICADIEARVIFIGFVKGLIEQAKNVQKRWRAGDYSVPYPLGLFPPTPARLGNIVPPYAFV